MLLSELKKGECAYVDALQIDGNMRRRLQDIGFVKNAIVKRIGTSPLGDPGVYLIKNLKIHLLAILQNHQNHQKAMTRHHLIMEKG